MSVSSASSSRSGGLAALGGSRGPEDLVETLYNHPSVKIIAFTTNQRSSFNLSPSTASDPPPGTLPASSQLERTIAVGNCGTALQPILPKSQCWCIDEGNSRFVLQVRRPQYWRIELPTSDADDVHRAFILREVFDRILLFEKTECPFERSFTVELPERPSTPAKKRPWTPVGKNLVSSPFASDFSPPSPSSKVAAGRRKRASTVTTQELAVAVEESETSTDEEPARRVASTHTPEAQLPETRSEIRSTAPSVASENEFVAAVADAKSSDNTPDEPKNDSSVPEFPEEEPECYFAPQTAERGEPTSLPYDVLEASSPENEAKASEQFSASPKSESCRLEHKKGTHNVLKTSTQSSAPLSQEEAQHSDDTGINSRLVPQALESTRTFVASLVAPSTMQPPQKAEPLEQMIPARTSASTIVTEKVPVGKARSGTEVLLATAQPSEQHVGTDGNEDAPPVPSTAEEIFGDLDDGPSSYEGSGGQVTGVNLKMKKMSRMLAGRSVSLPPQLTLITAPPIKAQKPAKQSPTSSVALVAASSESGNASPVGSTDSFHSVQSWHSPITPLPLSPPISRPESPASFPYPHDDILIPARQLSLRSVSELAVTPNTDATFVPSSAGTDTDETASPVPRSPADSKPASPLSVEAPRRPRTSHSCAADERSAIRNRARDNLSISRRALSPLPSAANLFSPQGRRRPATRVETVRKLPSAIIHKTVEILLSPPGHLVNLMLKVAAKIAAGEWRGLVFGFGEGGEQIPVHWDYSDGEFSSWGDDDDYNFSMGRFARQGSTSSMPRATRRSPVGSPEEDSRSWEVD
ncbi:inheritance of peroxisomes protein 1-domain-containing protein [Pseudomassariella vexata]|uniref:Inheritance of peroxisomes protein 1 n=1 Tax=Pseudomassariella vexata TaxID=1141098 RepID=A0A1Y2E6P9_9PEZI|nr:inheritance of peroxisomes protein 1-domain-containing protein [Pseudomassariella vexata]ORY67240.1 inheritance of peroxisomes protein 1-domain-containing protein [Pseudomassariella vexata]